MNAAPRPHRTASGLLVPPPPPHQAQRRAHVHAAATALLQTFFSVGGIFLLASAGMQAWALLLLAALLGPLMVLTASLAQQKRQRHVDHSWRWHTEPLYRARWENEQ